MGRNNAGRGGRSGGRSDGGRGGKHQDKKDQKADKKKYIFTTVGTTETHISSYKATLAKVIEHLGANIPEYPQDVVASIRAT